MQIAGTVLMIIRLNLFFEYIPINFSAIVIGMVISVTQFATHAQNRGGCFVFYLYNSRLAC